jgi:hypothetical protein
MFIEYESLTKDNVTNSDEINKPERQPHAIAMFFKTPFFENTEESSCLCPFLLFLLVDISILIIFFSRTRFQYSTHGC